jgi:hypothetical protein
VKVFQNREVVYFKITYGPSKKIEEKAGCGGLVALHILESI